MSCCSCVCACGCSMSAQRPLDGRAPREAGSRRQQQQSGVYAGRTALCPPFLLFRASLHIPLSTARRSATYQRQVLIHVKVLVGVQGRVAAKGGVQPVLEDALRFALAQTLPTLQARTKTVMRQRLPSVTRRKSRKHNREAGRHTTPTSSGSSRKVSRTMATSLRGNRLPPRSCTRTRVGTGQAPGMQNTSAKQGETPQRKSLQQRLKTPHPATRTSKSVPLSQRSRRSSKVRPGL